MPNPIGSIGSIRTPGSALSQPGAKATSISNINLSGLLKSLTGQYEESRVKRQAEYEEGKGILQQVVEMFGTDYLKGEEEKTLADVESGMAGRGLGGTTMPTAVSTGVKANIRDRATKGRVGAMTNVAQFMSGFQDIHPDPSTLAHLATGGFSGILQKAIASAPGAPLGPVLVGSGGTGPSAYEQVYGSRFGLTDPTLATERTTGPGPGVASETVSFGPSTPGADAADAFIDPYDWFL